MENNNFQLLSIGDASIDSFVTPTESETSCKLDTKECLICFSYGDKIPVKNLELSSGGNAANNAVGATRLGVKTAIVLTLGTDSIGNQIIDSLGREKVDLTYVIQQPATTSNYSIVINYSGERTIFTYHAPRSYEFPVALPVTPWVYLTSMGESFKPFYKHLYDWLIKNPTVKLAFNPGSWQLKSGLEGIGDILKRTDIVFVNREEAEKLTNSPQSSGKEKELLTAFSKLGPKMSVITDGGNGSFIFNGSIFLKVGILPVDPYERTGAGDAFGSGFLSAFIKGKPIEEALLWGTSNSASVIGYTGPQKGLIKESDMHQWLEMCKSSGVQAQQF
ncbi:MAG TPA: carbohydrate kinase family protein [Patescibacteria group bacterium]